MVRGHRRKGAGDHLIGVLKADADSLGQAIDAVLRANSDLRPLAKFSEKLDAFFAGRLKAEIESGRDPRWQWIYTIFAGGDDLIMVGPWDVMIDFAGRLRELFQAEFRDRGLTISAGVACANRNGRSRAPWPKPTGCWNGPRRNRMEAPRTSWPASARCGSGATTRPSEGPRSVW